jgi:hypothetical protein
MRAFHALRQTDSDTSPETLAKALTSAADKRLTSRSDYIRSALLDRLRADQVELGCG